MSRTDNSNQSVVLGGLALMTLVFFVITGVTGTIGQWFWLPLAAVVLSTSGKKIR